MSREGEDIPTEPWLEANMKQMLDNLIAHSGDTMANMKIQMDNAIQSCGVMNQNAVSHANNMNTYSEIAVKQALEFQEKANNDYLLGTQKQRDNTLENNRYTLDRLYSVFPEEAAGLGTMVTLVVEALRQGGSLKD